MGNNIPNSGLFNYDEEKEKIIINSIGKLNFKELFMEGLSPEFQKLFKENINLYFSQPFIEGASYEYGLFDKSKDTGKALKIYKDAADFKYDYLCMYRMHRIFLMDYEKFNVKKNGDLHRFYLYKCFAYLPFLIIDKSFFLLNKIDVTSELNMILENFENNKFIVFGEFIEFLEKNLKELNATKNDLKLMKLVFVGYFAQDTDFINSLLNELDKGDNAYFEAQLKYCNFALDIFGDKCDKQKIQKIFENLYKAGYYKCCCDYGRFLMKEGKYNEAKDIFKKGADKGQQFCFGDFADIVMQKTSYKQFLSDYNMASYTLKNTLIIYCIERLSKISFFYTLYYLSKHSSFKDKLKNNFGKYAKEFLKIDEKYFQAESEEYIKNNFTEKYIINEPYNFGIMQYYGIPDLISRDKERALICFKKSYQIAKEKEYLFYARINYLYIYKCRKYLFKNNKISLRKLNKTKEKLFRLYEETDIKNLDVLELYSYYKLCKIGTYGNAQNKMINILRLGKNENEVHRFQYVVYIEKCKVALEYEYSNNASNNNQNNFMLNNQNYNPNDINLYFKTMENQQYNIRVPKNIQFIIAIHKLYSIYPELESKKTASYVCNGDKICIFDTIEENGLQNGNIILIINKFK